jgi:hypothetical protein
MRGRVKTTPYLRPSATTLPVSEIAYQRWILREERLSAVSKAKETSVLVKSVLPCQLGYQPFVLDVEVKLPSETCGTREHSPSTKLTEKCKLECVELPAGFADVLSATENQKTIHIGSPMSCIVEGPQACGASR